MKIFISYASEDAELVKHIEQCCKELTVNYFLDKKDIAAGSRITAGVGSALKECTHIVVVWSPASVKSLWVPFEVGRAIERGMTVIPFLSHASLELPVYMSDILGVSSIDTLKKQLEIFMLAALPQADELVEKLAKVPATIQSLEVREEAKTALSKSVNLILSGFQEHLADIEKGRLSVRGPEMDKVFGIFVGSVKSGFRALSRDDLKYWASEESAQYLAHNRKLIDDGKRIERIFVVTRSKTITEEQCQAVRNQIKMGIGVKLAYYETCMSFQGVDNETDLDFGLFDDFAVSFFRFATGRVHKLSTSATDCQKYAGIYERVASVCEAPLAGDSKAPTHMSEASFRAWVDCHNAQVTLPPPSS